MFLLLCAPVAAFAQTDMWSDVTPPSAGPQGQALRSANLTFLPDRYRLLRLDASRMRSRLGLAQARGSAQTISIDVPLPDGTSVVLDVYDSPVMAPALAARYPEIRTYRARGRTAGAIRGRLDFTPQGFHGLLDTPDGQVYIDPRGSEGDRYYVSYYHRDYAPAEKTKQPLNCLVHDDPVSRWHQRSAASSLLTQANGNEIRTYRLAVAATGEYTAFHDEGDPVADALAAINTSINRVNQVTMRDLAIEFTLVADNDQIIYTDAGTDPYTNSDGFTLLNENQANLDSVIGSANYDIGHVFSTGGGGVATLAAVCNDSVKARGVTGSPAPINDPFDIDFVAHEIGHQLGADHTFNSTTSSCFGSRNAATAVEPGSGSTIMAYAGICGSNNLQNFSDPLYSTISIDEIVGYTVSGGGDICATTSGGTTPPSVSVSPAFTIPAATPFELTGSATDPDTGDLLTYSWEQVDAGTASDVDVVLSDNAIFRVFEPVPVPARVFPRLENLLNNNTVTGETLPDISRDLNFRLTARDQAGGVDGAQTLVQVHDTGEAFEVTAFNSSGTLDLNSAIEVTWAVAGTDASPINCSGVDISMSTDGGLTYPHELAVNTPNDGSATVVTPGQGSAQARIKVKCTDNVFFDINDVDQVLGDVNTAFFYEDVPDVPVDFDESSASCAAPLTRTIDVPVDHTIADLDFGFNADHTYRGDIDVLVRSPNGTEVLVVVFDGGNEFDDYDVKLDDSSALPLVNASDDDTSSPFYDREAAPSNPLSAFNGENAGGQWTVEICDNFDQDEGVYNRSALFILETDSDDDGLPDSSDPDDDNDGMSDDYENEHPNLDPFDDSDAGVDDDLDGLTNLEEFNNNESDPLDPDSDGDGIGDAFDLDVLGPSNLCDTSESILADQPVLDTEILQCAADVSILVEDTVDIQSGGRLELISPAITLQPGFSVPAGGELGIRSQNPVPGVVPP